MAKITLEHHEGITVLRDDLLPGGTKSVLLDKILPMEYDEFIYATPVFGGFQIALALWCKENKKSCTIFCAKRKEMHPNTLRVKEAGAHVVEVPYGYLNVVQSAAKKYIDADEQDLPYNIKRYNIPWGSHTEESIDLITERVYDVLLAFYESQGKMPTDIFIALGSGMLSEGILNACFEFGINVHGVSVGAVYEGEALLSEQFILEKYPKPFDKKANCTPPFPSMPNYDAKAWEHAKNYKFLNPEKNVLFWNVL